jgi:hypothetical protein
MGPRETALVLICSMFVITMFVILKDWKDND